MGGPDGVQGMSAADYGVCLPDEEQVSYADQVSEPPALVSYPGDEVKTPAPIKAKPAHRFVEDGFGGVSDLEKGVSLPGPTARIQTEKATGLMRKQSENWAATHRIERKGKDVFEDAVFLGLLVPVNKRVAAQQSELTKLFAAYDQLIAMGDYPAADRKLQEIQSRLDAFLPEYGRLNTQANEVVATYQRGYALDAPKEIQGEIKGNAQGEYIANWAASHDPVDKSDGIGVRIAGWFVDDVVTDHSDRWKAQQKELEGMHADMRAKARRGDNAGALAQWKATEAKIKVFSGETAKMRDESVSVAGKTVKVLEFTRDTAIAVEAGLVTGGFGGWVAKGSHWAVRGYIGMHAAIPAAMVMRGGGDALGTAAAGGSAKDVADAGSKGAVAGAKQGAISGATAVVTGGLVERLAHSSIPWVAHWFHGVEKAAQAGNASATEVVLHEGINHAVHAATPHH